MTNYIYLFLTLFLLAAGSTAVIQREFNLGFGRPKPIFNITLRETPAYANGIVDIVIGIVLLGIFLIDELQLIVVGEDTMKFILIVGMFIAVISFVFALMIQVTMRLGKSMQEKEKRKHDFDQP